MNKKELEHATKIFNELAVHYKSLRDIGKAIDADVADIYRWKAGKKKIRPNVVINICRLHDVSPRDFRPDIFDEDVILQFKQVK